MHEWAGTFERHWRAQLRRIKERAESTKRSPKALERAQSELLVGNVYLNRGITGAVVERHPFGGFKMSGTGTKAGGNDYLQNFLFSRVVAENVMRRGFTPPIEGE